MHTAVAVQLCNRVTVVSRLIDSRRDVQDAGCTAVLRLNGCPLRDNFDDSGETRATGRSDWSSFSFSVSRLALPLLAISGSKSSALEMYLGEINSLNQ